MARGGVRPNSGRKKGKLGDEALQRLEMRRQLTERVNNEFAPIMDAILDLAKGHYTSVQKEDGTVKVYKKAPNPIALQYLLDQTVGKAEQSLKILGQIDTTETHVVSMSPEDKKLLQNAIRYAIKGGKTENVIRGEVIKKD